MALRLVSRLAGEFASAEPRVLIHVQSLRAEQGFSAEGAGRLRARLGNLLNSEPVGISFGSEASRVARVAEEVIVIGPGDMRSAHSDRECVPAEELERWTNVLRALMND